MQFIFSIIATLLIGSLFFHSVLDAETNLTMVYRQLGWIAVIILIGFAQLDFLLSDIKHKKIETNKLIKEILLLNKPLEIEELEEDNGIDNSEETQNKNNYKIILITILIITIIAYFLFVCFSNKNTQNRILDNSHTPATNLYK